MPTLIPRTDSILSITERPSGYLCSLTTGWKLTLTNVQHKPGIYVDDMELHTTSLEPGTLKFYCKQEAHCW